MKRWCQPFGFHTRSFTNRFVCNFLSSSAGFNLCSCFSRLTLVVSDLSGPSVPHPIGASLPLSDLRCFRSLSVASVLDSDYSASALPFPASCLRPAVASSVLPPSLSLLRLSPFSPAWFPMRSTPVPVLSFAVCFLSLFPASLPQPFHRCSPLGVFRFRSAHFRSLLFRFQLLSLLFFLSALPQFRLTSASLLAASALASVSSPSLRPDLSCLPSRFSYSALLPVSFRPSLLRSRSRSTGDSLSDLSSGIGA